MTDLEKLISLAYKARKAFEKVAEIDRWKPNLSGLCFDASCFLRRLARENGIETELGKGDGHYFVLYGNVVIDITATQFGKLDHVCVLPLEEASKIGDFWKLYYSYKEYPIHQSCQEKIAREELEKLETEEHRLEL